MILYLDTSSLVKLYISESGSAEVAALVDRAQIVCTSVVAFPEARSAFARLHREGALTRDELERVREHFAQDWRLFLKIAAGPHLCERAGDLAERHALRGFDAVHLASYLEARAGGEGQLVRFSSFDARLDEAAEAALGARPSSTTRSVSPPSILPPRHPPAAAPSP
jgi:uncharacterized protein